MPGGPPVLARTPAWHPGLRYVVLVIGLGAAVVLFEFPLSAGRDARALAAVALGVALGGPAAYAWTTVTTAQYMAAGMLPRLCG